MKCNLPIPQSHKEDGCRDIADERDFTICQLSYGVVLESTEEM
jgi:hypothetical protein